MIKTMEQYTIFALFLSFNSEFYSPLITTNLKRLFVPKNFSWNLKQTKSCLKYYNLIGF